MQNLVRIFQETPYLLESYKNDKFCKILQDSVRIMHYLASSCMNLARILKEMHFVPTSRASFVLFISSTFFSLGTVSKKRLQKRAALKMNTANLVASSLLSVFLILHYITPFSSCANSFSGSINWRPSGKRSSPNFLNGHPVAFEEDAIPSKQADTDDEYTRAQIIQVHF